MCCLMTDLALTTLIPNKNPQEYQIFHFFPFRFSLNNVSLFVNISDIFCLFDALRIAMLIAQAVQKSFCVLIKVHRFFGEVQESF